MTNDAMTTFTVPKKSDEGKWAPVRMPIEILFTDDSRRVTPADLQRAAEAAMTAARASLESRSPAYTIASMSCRLEYLYVKVQRVLKG